MLRLPRVASGLSRIASGLLRACHPEPAAAVTVVTALLALVGGRSAGAVAEVAVAMLACQLSVGWSNDWLDAGRDTVVGRADKPIPAGQVSRRTVGVAALLAGVLTVPLALLIGVTGGRWLILGLISGLAYNWPLKFTVFSPLPYLVSFGALAAFAIPDPPWWAVAAAALLGAGAHFVNVLPDLADDARTGVRGLPHRLGATGSWLTGGALLLAATATLVLGPGGRPSLAGLATLLAAAVVLPVGGVAARRAGSRAAFRSVLLVALTDVILLLVSGGIR